MPELPEVETTRRGIEPHVVGRKVTAVTVRDRRLRWPISDDLEERLQGARVLATRRRAKYLLIDFQGGSLLVHLGMSGSLRLVMETEEPRKHDHVDIGLDSGFLLRYHDPRRFGSMHWLDDASHMLLDHLGPEPLATDFSADYLYRISRKRSAPVKHFIMDAKVVVGVGNIYANEALFMAGIRPDRAANKISQARYELLVDAIKQVLATAIEVGGTTLRDFVGGDGKAGYFAQSLQVYGRAGEPCKRCKDQTLREIRQSNRSTVFCSSCQR
ncbi:MAG: bifunctional DNA-formamidopyrimidine glycosylase/DNA-(apurinic or apyrimidinic site) lyase [Proteobacteria bacterium]|nr:MAG: bifunctional DNA-formamidopyrimidine glycosylase/DNA-(apurinic or apyrimidinic site) lyase [Pseudomonadota bacterium]